MTKDNGLDMFFTSDEVWFNQGDRSLKMAFNMGKQPIGKGGSIWPPDPFVARVDAGGKLIGCIEFSYVAIIKGQVVYEATELLPASDIDQLSDRPLVIVTGFRQFPT